MNTQDGHALAPSPDLRLEGLSTEPRLEGLSDEQRQDLLSALLTDQLWALDGPGGEISGLERWMKKSVTQAQLNVTVQSAWEAVSAARAAALSWKLSELAGKETGALKAARELNTLCDQLRVLLDLPGPARARLHDTGLIREAKQPDMTVLNPGRATRSVTLIRLIILWLLGPDVRATLRRVPDGTRLTESARELIMLLGPQPNLRERTCLKALSELSRSEINRLALDLTDLNGEIGQALDAGRQVGAGQQRKARQRVSGQYAPLCYVLLSPTVAEYESRGEWPLSPAVLRRELRSSVHAESPALGLITDLLRARPPGTPTREEDSRLREQQARARQAYTGAQRRCGAPALRWIGRGALLGPECAQPSTTRD